jgi:hypothetical protein
MVPARVQRMFPPHRSAALHDLARLRRAMATRPAADRRLHGLSIGRRLDSPPLIPHG